MSERVAIRGPGAEQVCQPQRVQPGGFFRPLFGRSKRGHPDAPGRQDDYTTETTYRVSWSNHREGEGHLPSKLSPAEQWKTKACGGRTAGCGQCDWPHRRQGGRLRERRYPQRFSARDLKGVLSTRDGG
jgi:hypothetical protein